MCIYIYNIYIYIYVSKKWLNFLKKWLKFLEKKCQKILSLEHHNRFSSDFQ